ncbi:hypothetical protein [Paenibacillus marinisediminis]
MLQDELIRNTPDVWGEIQRKIAENIVSELLQELDGVPSPHGRLFGEIRESIKQNCYKQGA